MKESLWGRLSKDVNQLVLGGKRTTILGYFGANDDQKSDNQSQ